MVINLREWLKGFALSYSLEEIIEAWPMSQVKWRRKLVLAPSKRAGDGHNLVCKVYHEKAKAGQWAPAAFTGKSGTVVWKTGDPRGREEPTSRCILRHWKQWRDTRVLTASFFRIGVRSGAHLMSPGGECETICQPPTIEEPLATVPILRPVNGFLVPDQRQNPEWERWKIAWGDWLSTVNAVRGFIDSEVTHNVLFDGIGQPCDECDHVPRTVDPWHRVHEVVLCPECYRNLCTKPERD